MAENDSYQKTKNFHIYLTETRILLDTAAKGKFYCCFDAWLRYYQLRDTLTESVIDGLRCNFCAILRTLNKGLLNGWVGVCVCAVLLLINIEDQSVIWLTVAENTAPACAFLNTFLWTLVTKDCKCINKCFLLFIVIVSFRSLIHFIRNIESKAQQQIFHNMKLGNLICNVK